MECMLNLGSMGEFLLGKGVNLPPGGRFPAFSKKVMTRDGFIDLVGVCG